MLYINDSSSWIEINIAWKLYSCISVVTVGYNRYKWDIGENYCQTETAGNAVLADRLRLMSCHCATCDCQHYQTEVATTARVDRLHLMSCQCTACDWQHYQTDGSDDYCTCWQAPSDVDVNVTRMTCDCQHYQTEVTTTAHGTNDKKCAPRIAAGRKSLSRELFVAMQNTQCMSRNPIYPIKVCCSQQNNGSGSQ